MFIVPDERGTQVSYVSNLLFRTLAFLQRTDFRLKFPVAFSYLHSCSEKKTA